MDLEQSIILLLALQFWSRGLSHEEIVVIDSNTQKDEVTVGIGWKADPGTWD